MRGAAGDAGTGARRGALGACLIFLALLGHDAGAQGLSCTSFHSQEDAQAVYESNLRNGAGDRFGLDPDGDGIACEEVPTRDGSAPVGNEPPTDDDPPTGGEPAADEEPVAGRGTYHFPDPREADIDGYWQRAFAEADEAYTSPAGLLPVGPAAFRDACGGSHHRGHYTAFYCAADSKIYFDEEIETWVRDVYGDLAWTLVMAHEWGHHVQFVLDPFAGWGVAGVTIELQADCLAGVYFADAVARDWIDQDEIGDALLLFAESDAAETHGTGQEQVEAFALGFAEGPPGCGVSL